MRWLLVHPGPDFSVHDVHEGWREALTGLGETVAVYNLNDRLSFYSRAYIQTGETDETGHPIFRKAVEDDQVVSLGSQNILAAVMAGWPDVVMFVSGLFTPWQILAVIRSRGIPVVMLHTETPYEDPRQLELSANADITLLNDPVTIGQYLDVCPVVAYSPHAYRPSVHYPRKTRKRFDLVFSGTGYDSRIEFFEAMRLDGLRVGLGGNWAKLADDSALRPYLLHAPEHCLDNAETAKLYGQAKAGINFYRREHEDNGHADGWAAGPREIEMAACGLWFLRDPRGEGDELFPALPVFTSPEEAGEQLRWAVRHPKAMADGAAKARRAIESRTFSSNAQMLLRLLETRR